MLHRIAFTAINPESFSPFLMSFSKLLPLECLFRPGLME
jgi:hypothetical protein